MMTIMMMILNDNDAEQNHPGSVMSPNDPRKASITPYKSEQELLADLKGLLHCLFAYLAVNIFV